MPGSSTQLNIVPLLEKLTMLPRMKPSDCQIVPPKSQVTSYVPLIHGLPVGVHVSVDALVLQSVALQSTAIHFQVNPVGFLTVPEIRSPDNKPSQVLLLSPE